ncbi:MAG: hypothetical protein GXO54_06395 [Chloroflexi bacterium]|nr:hypothetical protein [Chloroflexota bacterium]
MAHKLDFPFPIHFVDWPTWPEHVVMHIAQALTRWVKAFPPASCWARVFAGLRLHLHSDLPHGALARRDAIRFHPRLFQQRPAWLAQVAVVHELAHVWAFRAKPRALAWLPIDVLAWRLVWFAWREPGPTRYGRRRWLQPSEEWAETVAAYVYPEYLDHLRRTSEPEAWLGPKHRTFVQRVYQTMC